MPSSSSLEKEVLKYEKRGFKSKQKKKLRYGLRIYLDREKEGFLFNSSEGIYIYFAEGDATNDCLRECFKDYLKFYQDKEFDENDKGFFMTTGCVDEKLFKDLRKAVIDDEDIRSSIKLAVLENPYKELKKEQPTAEAQPVKGTKKEDSERVSLASSQAVDSTRVKSAIEAICFVPSERERQYEAQLYQCLLGKGFDTVYEKSLGPGARFDLVIGRNEVAVELKIINGKSDVDRLVGQIMRYKKSFGSIIVVLIDRLKNPSVMKREIERIEEVDQEKVIVIRK
jgi:hypothetical protein